MSGATDCQLETALMQAPKRKTLHFLDLTGSHWGFRGWDATSVISVLVARFAVIPARPDSRPKFGP
jgi:hypothetical protein